MNLEISYRDEYSFLYLFCLLFSRILYIAVPTFGYSASTVFELMSRGAEHSATASPAAVYLPILLCWMLFVISIVLITV